MNKPFVTDGTDSNKSPSLDGLNEDKLVNELNGLPDNLLKPNSFSQSFNQGNIVE